MAKMPFSFYAGVNIDNGQKNLPPLSMDRKNQAEAKTAILSENESYFC